MTGQTPNKRSDRGDAFLYIYTVDLIASVSQEVEGPNHEQKLVRARVRSAAGEIVVASFLLPACSISHMAKSEALL